MFPQIHRKVKIIEKYKMFHLWSSNSQETEQNGAKMFHYSLTLYLLHLSCTFYIHQSHQSFGRNTNIEGQLICGGLFSSFVLSILLTCLCLQASWLNWITCYQHYSLLRYNSGCHSPCQRCPWSAERWVAQSPHWCIPPWLWAASWWCSWWCWPAPTSFPGTSRG